MSAFGLTIVTPSGQAFSGDVEYLSVPLSDGRAGFMRGALPRVCVLSAGEIKATLSQSEKRFMCGDGILRVSVDGITVITSACKDTSSVQIANDKTDDDQIKYAKVKIASSINASK